MIYPVIKWSYRIAALVIAAVLLWANMVFHRTPVPSDELGHARALAQFHYLKGEMHGGAPQEMQRLFPEGAPFAYALYGLAACNLADRVVEEQRKELLDEARWSLDQLDSDEVKGRFPLLLAPDHGAFLSGWTAYLHGNLLGALYATERSDEEIARFRARCDTIAGTLAHSEQPFIESNGMAWPADVMVCVAALAQHDALFPSFYSSIIQDWVRVVEDRLDESGMLAHAWDPVRDAPRTSARGSSMALMNVFLPTIDSSLAKKQFKLFKQNFLSSRFGLPAVLEHPIGTSGHGDIDSGPLIFGIGPAATIVGAGACRRNGDVAGALALESTVDAFGFTTGAEVRRYLFGALPIADLFIVWCRSMRTSGDITPKGPSSIRFHAWSILLVLLLFTPLAVGHWRSRRNTRRSGSARMLQ
jgi:hypothetical protein